MRVRPFYLVGDAHLQACERKVRQAVADWAQAWFATAPAIGVECVHADGAEAARMKVGAMVAGAAQEWFAAWPDAGFEAALACALAGNRVGGAAEAIGSIERRLLDRVRADLVRQVAIASGVEAAAASEAAGGETQELLQAAAAKGGGCVAASVALEGARLRLLVGPGLIKRMVESPRRLAPARRLDSCLEALVGKALEMQGVAGRVTLTIGDLQSLKAGDILRLDRSIGEPVLLESPGGQPVGQGYLGKSEGQRALQVAA
jgi:hypothetical protein